jgi:syntaxin-binding protein 1
VNEEYALSRFEPTLKRALDDLSRGALDQAVFPYVKPPMDPNEDAASMQGSLRQAAPRWAGAGRRVVENRQRVIVFVAGGATYSEARSCYEISAAKGKDVFLATSHMLNPGLYLRQVRDLSVDKRRLDLPQDRPRPKAPAHLFERPAPPPQQRPVPPAGGIPPGPRPPTKAMGNMNLGPGPSAAVNGGSGAPPPAAVPNKLGKEKEKEHKKKRFFGIKK